MGTHNIFSSQHQKVLWNERYGKKQINCEKKIIVEWGDQVISFNLKFWFCLKVRINIALKGA